METKAEGKLILLETNIDDMSPQIYGYLYERLFAAGARDVWLTPIYMKKNRPANMLSVLLRREDKDKCADIIFAETTSIGIRVRAIEERLEAQRRFQRVATPYGEITCKVSEYAGKVVSVTPEYEDCAALARTSGAPLKEIQRTALAAFYGHEFIF